jgi:FAD/FMN-containing dehydrogenase
MTAPPRAAPESVAGWGRVPVRPGRVARPERLLLPPGEGIVLPRGLGRAYGDAAVPAREDTLVLATPRADRILDWDPVSGRLTAEAGLSFAEILRLFLPRGWFPPVTPGTKFVTLGGCVASDVHGKNHHRDGSFGGFVERLGLITANGREIVCGPDLDRDLFLATIGGMGLTGLITEVTVRLRPVETGWIAMETEAVANLERMVEALAASREDWPYTVGWIDCLAAGPGLGRGVLMRGRHATRAEVPTGDPRGRRALRVPGDAPEWLLSPGAMRAFNGLYYWLKAGRRRGTDGPHRSVVSYESFFYPLDMITDWNRLYGRRGFLQFQCVVPRAAGLAAMRELLERIARAGAASFLAVIKDCGPAGPAPLSFPMEGVTLGLDLPHRGPATVELVHTLNAVVIAAGGRIYLAKDAVTRPEDFARMMPRLPEWRAVRDHWDPAHRFRSAQSVRLHLTGEPPPARGS